MMKRTWNKWLAAVLAAVLVLGCVPAAMAAKEAKYSSDLYEDEWFYLPGTVPAEYLVATIEPRSIWMYNEWEKREYVTSLTVDFVSGDEALKDAVTVVDTTERDYSNDEVVEFSVKAYQVDLSGLTAPGQAVFHLKGETEHFAKEWDYTLRVLSWDEDPLFTAKEGGTLTVNKGEERAEAQIIASMVDDHSREIAVGKLGFESFRNEHDYIWFRDPKTRESVEVDSYWIGATNNEEPKTPVVHMMDPFGNTSAYSFRDYVTYVAEYYIAHGNIRYTFEKTVTVLPYRIKGPGMVDAGESVQYTVEDEEEGSGRTFTLEGEGAGISFDSETGTLSASEDAEAGSAFTVTATPSDGGYPFTFTGKIGKGLMASEEFEGHEMIEGFSVPFPVENGRYTTLNSRDSYYSCRTENESDPYYLFLDYRIYNPISEFVEDPDTAGPTLDLAQYNMEIYNQQEVEEETYMVDGHPARLRIMRAPMDNDIDFSIGGIFYPRNNRVLRIRLAVTSQNGTSWEELPKVTMDDLRTLADQITYDPAKASITVADGAITVTAKDGVNVVSGGKKLKLTAEFASPDKVSKKKKNNSVQWSVVDVNTQEAPENVKIDKNGNLSATGKLAEVLNLEVKATSPVFHTTGTYQVTAIPALKKMTLEPATLFFYTGTDTPQTVKAVMEPATVPPTGLTWTAGKKDTVEITAADDGTAEIRPLTAGKVTVTVKAPDGKSAKLNISTVEPVTGVTLAVKGTAKAGKTVNVTAALEPKKAGNKALEWSVNVGEDVATINAKGQLKIAKTAEAGTVITVTCKALGAPEPIEETLDITVE